MSRQVHTYNVDCDTSEMCYLRRQTRPQQIMIKQIASPAKMTATIVATVSNKIHHCYDLYKHYHQHWVIESL